MSFKKDYGFVICVDHHYILAVQALINSIIKFNMHKYADVILLYSGFDPYEMFSVDNLNLKCFQVDKRCIHVAHARYLMLEKFAKEYKSLCIMDGDMFFTADVRKFFEIAQYGFNIGCNNDSTSMYHTCIKNGEGGLCVDNLTSYCTLCNVPFFFNYNKSFSIWKKYSDLYDVAVTKSDYELFNYSVFTNSDIIDNLIIYPSSAFTGVHHTFFKPQTFFRFDLYRDDMVSGDKETILEDCFVVSNDYTRVYSIHGHYFHPGWVENCISAMRSYYIENGTNQERQNHFFNRNRMIMKNLNKIFLSFVFGGTISFEQIEQKINQHQKEYVLKLKNKIL